MQAVLARGEDPVPDQVHDIELAGCSPEPLMAYLKALGILRLVAEQVDPSARGWWKDDAFVLRSALNGEALVTFFLDNYAPTPIVAPWAGGSGFFDKDNRRAVDAIAHSTEPRLGSYRALIGTVRRILKEEGVASKPSDEMKTRLLQRYRRELPLPVVEWMDAVMVLRERGQGFAPLLGTGGNDGRLDFSQNFMSRLVTLGIPSCEVNELSEAWLRNALFWAPTRQLEHAAVGQFAPGRAGGPNATQGLEGNATDNPWDFVLMLEGALVLGGAAVRRFQAGDDASRAAFPFTVRPIAAGYVSAGEKDDRKDAKNIRNSRGEIWLPLWGRAATITELRVLFAEGRADLFGRPARHGLDFARAVATLGVDRGIKLFSRYSFLKRSGKAYLATPLGRFEVRARGEVDLLREVDPWLGTVRRVAGGETAPPRFRWALRRIDRAIFDLCRYGGRMHLQAVLAALGRAEREFGLTAGRVGQNKITVRPVAGLSDEWIRQSDDGSHEFAIARALASVHDAESKIGPLRVNLDPVSVGSTREGRGYAKWLADEKDSERRHRAIVWNAADLILNLGAVLERRYVDAQRVGCENLPLASGADVGLDVVAAFISGEVDDARIEELLWGLILVDGKRAGESHARPSSNGGLLPRAYALLKLLFLPRPLVIERRDDERVRVRLARSGEEGIRVKPEPVVLHLLRAGRIGEACTAAMRRLRAAGLNPLPRPVRGRHVRDDDWRQLERTNLAGLDARRIAAALLIPISGSAITALAAMVASPKVSDDVAVSEAFREGDALALTGGG
jgi:CRISPR-associated protein Csx17